MVGRECAHVDCWRVPRARGLCEMHYGQLKRAGLGTLQRKQPTKPVGVQSLAQQGKNRSCVDCGGSPFGGGMRCLPCFQVRCDGNRARIA